MSYVPAPLDTSVVQLDEVIIELTEQLARHTHDVWAQNRLANGWRYGPQRDDGRKEHPCLVPYEDLSETEKQVDRDVALQTLKAILALGYRLTR